MKKSEKVKNPQKHITISRQKPIFGGLLILRKKQYIYIYIAQIMTVKFENYAHLFVSN